MFDLPGHDGTGHALAMKCIYKFGKFSEGQPMDRSSAARFNIRRSFFFDRGDHNFVSLRASSLEHQERKPSITRDEAKLLV